MTPVVFLATAVVLGAAIISVSASVQPFSASEFLSAIMLTLAAVIQRVNGIQRWLSDPKDKHKEQVNVLAQQALVEVCTGRTVSSELLNLCVHVWEVPTWYRRLFPYKLRIYLKGAVKRERLRWLAKWTFRPTLRRVAAVGLVRPPPSGVKFKKGVGLIGVCIANNDRSEFVTLNTSNSRYRRALNSPSEAVWLSCGPEITHNLSLEDARRLSHSYGQVISRVVQDAESGEAIGCVTISLKDSSASAVRLETTSPVKDKLSVLAQSVANVLA